MLGGASGLNPVNDADLKFCLLHFSVQMLLALQWDCIPANP